MLRISFLFASALSVAMGACSPDRPAPMNQSVDIDAAAAAARNDIASYAAGRPMPAPSPPAVAPAAPDSAQGAAAVVQTYYALLAARRYRAAWALWDDGGTASGMSADAFAARFAAYGAYRATIGAPGAPGAIDAGAGQRYVAVPVQVEARRTAGDAPVHLAGSVTLHRIGDIDGATPAQKSWHLRSADLAPR